MHGNMGWIHDLNFWGLKLGWRSQDLLCIYPGKLAFMSIFVMRSL